LNSCKNKVRMNLKKSFTETSNKKNKNLKVMIVAKVVRHNKKRKKMTKKNLEIAVEAM